MKPHAIAVAPPAGYLVGAGFGLLATLFFALLAVHVAGAAAALLYVQDAWGWTHQAPKVALLAFAWAVGIALAATPRSA